MLTMRISSFRATLVAALFALSTAIQPVSAAPSGFGSGVQLVGMDIQPGTYRSTSTAGGCYWERLSGVGGTFSEILANDNVSGPAVVTIAKGDYAFDSHRCGEWSADLSPITASPTAPFGQGDFIVGTDISPGLWRSSGGTSCYWERRSGFSGSFSDIIANDNTGATATVKIAASDVGFSSSRCGTWTKIG